MSPRPKHARQKCYFVYLLLCKNKAIYVGITTNVKRRFAEHKKGTGARYTRTFGAVKILYTEKVATRGAALKREYAIKQLSAAQKQKLAKRSRLSFSF